MDDNNTPSLGEIWEFLVAFKETTVESFGRVERQISALSEFQEIVMRRFESMGR